MLQSTILEPLLTQMLKEHLEITPLIPLSVSFVSKSGYKPLVTYTRKPQQGDIEGLEISSYTPNEQYQVKEHNGYVQMSATSAPQSDSIQGEIDHLNNLQFEDDYINTDSNPQSLLNVIGLNVIREWCEFLSKSNSEEASKTQVFEHDQFLFYMHNVNELYGVMVICQRDYPSELCMGKLDNLCTLLSQKL